ncbi:MAG: carboxypeptidase regulatory-like domain-containing protein [Euryarchaeota archaeon]|nr:carboxypeptidase regulatory-like domain-containing protein [Euryarchaeota archaeon]
MEVRIRTLLRPLTYSLALLMDRLGIPANALVWLSYITAVGGFISLFLLIDDPYSDYLVVAALVSMFLNGISAETSQEYTMRKAMVSELERPEFFFDRYTDIFIIFGAALFIGEEKYGIYVTRGAGLLLGVTIVLGMLLRDIITGKDGQSLGGERMFLLAAFGFLGPRLDPVGHFNPFREYIFYGMLTMALLIWVPILRAGLARVPVRRPGVPSMPGLPLGRLLEGIITHAPRVRLPRPEGRPPRATGEPLVVGEEVSLHNFTVLVAEEGTESGVIGAEVRLLNKETGESKTLKTDLEGRITFEDMPEGQYVVTVKADGFLRQDFDRYISTDTGDVLYIKKASQDLSVVVNDDVRVRPIPNAMVSLLSQKTGSVIMRKTDNLGVAYYESLEKGNYKITVEAPGYLEARGSVNLEKENMVSMSLTPVVEVEAGFDPEEMGGSALVEYDQGSGVEDMVVQMVKDLRGSDRPVYLVCPPSKAGMYRRRLKDVRIITLPTEGAAPTDDEAIEEIPMTNLEYFKAVFDEMPESGVFLFEPLSNLILNIGMDGAYKFISSALDHLTRKGPAVYAFINRDVHDRREVSSFENIFLNIFKADKGRLKKLK